MVKTRSSFLRVDESDGASVEVICSTLEDGAMGTPTTMSSPSVAEGRREEREYEVPIGGRSVIALRAEGRGAREGESKVRTHRGGSDRRFVPRTHFIIKI